MEHGPNGAQRRTGETCRSMRAHQRSLRSIPPPGNSPAPNGPGEGLHASAPIRRGEGAAREGALARYEPSLLLPPLPGVIHEGIAGAAAGAGAGAAAAAFAFLAFAFDFFAFFAMFDLPIAVANGPNLMPALE